MFLYRLLSPLISAVFVLRGLWAVIRGAEQWRDLPERIIGPRHPGPQIWVHGASVGELNAARPVLEALSDGRRRFLVTATTVTGRDTVRGWGMAGVAAGLAQLDIGWITHRMLRANQITSLIVLENELWPARILACHEDGLPVVMLNARMSESSARTWTRFALTAERVLRPMRLIAPQDAGSAHRFEALGADAVTIAPPQNLKALYTAKASTLPAELVQWAAPGVVLAAATHDGEDTIVLEAFTRLRALRPDVRLILAPRHPARGAALAAMIRAHGFDVAQRSAGETPHNADVLLADTLGEMSLWYRLAPVGFIGGSLVDKGGHTPFEPAAYGCGILHGPSVTNFAAPYAALDAASGAELVQDAKSLAQAWDAHLDHSNMPAIARSEVGTQDMTDLLDRLRRAIV